MPPIPAVPPRRGWGGVDIDRETGIAVGRGDRRGAGLFYGLGDFDRLGLVGCQLDDDGNVDRLAHRLGDVEGHFRVLADHGSAVHARHQSRMRTAKIQLNHWQVAILDGAADILPAFDVLRAGAANQVGIAFAGIGTDLFQIGDPVLVISAGIARPAVKLEVARHLALNNVATVVHDRVFRVHGQNGHVVDIRQRLDDSAGGTVIERLFHQVRAVGGFQRCDDDRVFERYTAEIQ